MKSIMAEAEGNTSSQTPPKDGLSTVKWTPRTPPRPERMPAPPVSLSTGKKIDLKITPAATPGYKTVVRPDITSSGLSMTRPQELGPAPGGVGPQAQTPPKTLVSKPPTHIPPPSTRTQSTQASQTITPVKLSAGSPSIRRTSSVPLSDHPHSDTDMPCLGVAVTRGRTTPQPTDNLLRVA